MRLIHTADWHLGQTLHQFERSYEHQCFLDWLLDTLVAEHADALLIAGDVFDNSNPAAATQLQFYRFLTEARRRVPHLNILIAAGNHDSPGRMEAPGPFLTLMDATVVGQVGNAGAAPDFSRLVVPLKDAESRVRAWAICMPFLRPSDLPRLDTEQDAYVAGIAALYRDACRHAAERRQPGQAIIAMGHCHVSGGQVSEDSERRIVIGGAEALPVSLFDPAIAYVALGHLHRAQRAGGDSTRRYSGSPLPMSFSEIDYPHQVVAVDLEGEAVREVRAIPVPRAVDLLRVPAAPAPLPEVLAALQALQLPPRPLPEQAYLMVRVLLTQPEPSLRSQVEAALEGKPLRLARIETTHARAPGEEAAGLATLDDLHALTPAACFQKLYWSKYKDQAPAPLLEAFNQLLLSGEGLAE
ncbi:MAG: exonuclease SbcCD subunit D C-terminal domain-containing protein [Rhodocyclaceae bacterium]|nr:exonuclease SbcCD subunit D C-terminal domain-containing protein [Rhodocyclaceae bacterium]MBX3669479.1 exonuclease SbcCD subunit D C-terminal domain-containing protein [Rhodocyclaceae bacterium]